MGGKAHILVVDDDPAVRALVAALLGAAGHRVTQAADGLEMRGVLDADEVDLILLDLMLPDADGTALAREVRARSGVGIIMLTSRTGPDDRAGGLEGGADDYVTKPFYPRELLARVRNVLDRTRGRPAPAGEVWRFEGWALDIENRSLTGPSGPADLTPAEFDLLALLVTRAGRILGRDRLVTALSGSEADTGPRAIDILISRLRRKLGDPALIETCRGHGYRFAPAVTRG
ncbi:MAG: response regulator transcription factor [Alphaproteobacteria bacterium]|nr:response regulator transcription factor [Alphaproteobacteria bacterium]